MEIVPNSSGEGSTCDEEMSQEIPLQAGKRISYYLPSQLFHMNRIVIYSVDTKCKAITNKTETRNTIQCHEDARSLSNVIQDQEYLISYLRTLSELAISLLQYH